jgi:hypothetical protein
LACASDRNKVAEIIFGATEDQRSAALDRVMDLLQDGTAQEVAKAVSLVQSATASSPAPAYVQRVVVEAMIRLAQRSNRCPEVVTRTLGEQLFLSHQEADSGPQFALRCSHAWARSCLRNPRDPLNDPERLTSAILGDGGGRLTDYLARSDGPRQQAVIDGLLGAAQAAGPGAKVACDKLISAGTDAADAHAKGRVNLALCGLLETTGDPALAGRIRDHLAGQAQIDSRDLLCRWDMGDATKRRRAAEVFSRKLRGDWAVPASMIDDLFAQDKEPVDAMTDFAVTALALRARAERICGRGQAAPACAQLEQVVRLESPDKRAQSLIEGISLEIAAPAARPTTTKAAEPAPKEVTLADLRKQLDSSSRTTRYQALDKLQEMDTDDAADLLLQGLDAQAEKKPADAAAVRKILLALKNMKSSQIPRRLAKILQLAKDEFAGYEIDLALHDILKAVPTGGLFPYKSTRRQRTEAAEFWAKRAAALEAAKPAPKPPAAIEVPPPPAASQVKLELSAGETATLKLLARAAADLRACGKELQAYHWGKPAKEAAPAAAATAGVNGGSELAKATSELVDELKRLAREHPCAPQFSARIDKVLSLHGRRSLLCENDLQAAAVDLHVAGQLLEIIASECDSGQAAADALRAAGTERAARLKQAGTVAQELRASAYGDLAVWDILQKSAQPPRSP